MRGLHALAAAGPVSVYPAIGPGMAAAVRRLALEPDVELVATPRHASVLLVAGAIPEPALAALRRVHAQLPRPCATLWYRSEPLPEIEQPLRVDDFDALPDALKAVQRAVLQGPPEAEPILLPNAPPAPFAGRGDHGQGGEGMMGGTPYGRPMAMSADDNLDGLALDPLTFSIGPFFPGLPPGLVLELILQGDVVQQCRVQAPPYRERLAAPFAAALERPVPIAALELARAEHHLHRLAEVLRRAGLTALGRRLLRAAATLAPGRRLRWLRPMLGVTGVLDRIGSGCGRIDNEQAAEIGGPAARALGLTLDARSADRGYQALGFEPVLQRAGDVRARWRQWLDEIEQALRLAARASETGAETAVIGSVEAPAGRLSADQPLPDRSPILEDLLPRCEWDEAFAVIDSLALPGASAQGLLGLDGARR